MLRENRIKEFDAIVKTTMGIWLTVCKECNNTSNETRLSELKQIKDKAEAEWHPAFNEWYKLSH